MQRWIQVGLLAVCLGGLIGIGLNRCHGPDLRVNTIAALPQDDLIQVYMNQNLATSYTEPYRRQTRPGDDLEQILVDQIQAAQSSIAVAVQELRLPRIAQALSDRHAAGVQVRVILENTYSHPWSMVSPEAVAQLDRRQRSRYQENFHLIDRNGNGRLSPEERANYDALQILSDRHIPWIDDTADGSAGSGLMHHKFVVVDGATVVVTSANFTHSGIHGDFAHPESRGNANSLVVINSPPVATLFTQEFNTLWGDGPGGQANSRFGVNKPQRSAQSVAVGDATVWVQFSPTSARVPWQQSTNGFITGMLQQAQTSIDLALFVFSEQQIVNGLAHEQNQGTTIRALIDPGFAYRPYSEALDMLGVALSRRTTPCQVEPNNQPWQPALPSVGTPRLPEGDLLHHKFGVMDGTTVLVGSHNWSAAANQRNDETLLAIASPTVAAHYQREFERLYASSRLGVPPFLNQKLQVQKQQCGTLSTAQTPSKSPPSASLSSSPSSPSPTPLTNLNTATQAELEALPGIGPKLAERIIQARQQEPFTSLEDLDRVPGIGPKLLQTLQDQVTW